MENVEATDCRQVRHTCNGATIKIVYTANRNDTSNKVVKKLRYVKNWDAKNCDNTYIVQLPLSPNRMVGRDEWIHWKPQTTSCSCIGCMKFFLASVQKDCPCILIFSPIARIHQTKFYLSTKYWVSWKGWNFCCVEGNGKWLVQNHREHDIRMFKCSRGTNPKYVMTMRCMAMTREYNFPRRCTMTPEHFASVRSWEANWQHVHLEKCCQRCEQWYVNTKHIHRSNKWRRQNERTHSTRHFYMQIWCSIHFVFNVRRTTIPAAATAPAPIISVARWPVAAPPPIHIEVEDMLWLPDPYLNLIIFPATADRIVFCVYVKQQHKF